MRGNEWNCKRASALRRCHQMSDSAIPRAEYPKITATSRNMHITGKEKTSAAKPVQEVLAVGEAFSDGECEVVGNRCPLPISLRFNSPGLSPMPVPPQLRACVRTAPQPCQSKSCATRWKGRSQAVSAKALGQTGFLLLAPAVSRLFLL